MLIRYRVILGVLDLSPPTEAGFIEVVERQACGILN